MLPKQCPNCGGLTEKDGKSCSCGWRAIGAKEAATGLTDRQCNGRDNGMRCQLEGHLSMSVRGGPWYCRRHYDLETGHGQEVGKAENRQHMQLIRELIKRKTALPMREPGEDEREVA